MAKTLKKETSRTQWDTMFDTFHKTKIFSRGQNVLKYPPFQTRLYFIESASHDIMSKLPSLWRKTTTAATEAIVLFVVC